MSACISREGEYTHILGTAFSCSRYGVFNEDAALAKVDYMRSKIAYMLGDQNNEFCPLPSWARQDIKELLEETSTQTS